MKYTDNGGKVRLNWIFPYLLVVLPFGAWQLPIISIRINYIVTIIAGTVAIFSINEEISTSVYSVFLILLQALLILWITVSDLVTTSSDYMGIIPQVGYFIWTCSIIIINQNQKDWYRCIGGLLSGAVIAGILTVIISIFEWNVGLRALPRMSMSTSRIPFFRRVIGAPLSFGAFGMLSIGAFGYSYTCWKRHSKYTLGYFLFGFSSLVLFSSLIISQSRSTWVGTVTAIIGSLGTFYIIKNIESNWKYKNTIGYIGIITGFLLILSFPILVKAMRDLGKQSFDTRFDQYIVAIDTIASNPIFGVGQAYRFDLPYEIHNAYLNLGARAGLPALIIVIFLTIAILTALWRTIQITSGTNRLSALAVLSGVIGVVIESQFVAGFSRFGWIWFAIAVSFYSVNINSD
jgi:hypothetical protein